MHLVIPCNEWINGFGATCWTTLLGAGGAGCNHGEERCDDGLPSQCRDVIRPVRTRDPIDDLLVRAIAAIDALGRGMARPEPARRFAVLGCACVDDAPDVPIDVLVEQLRAGVFPASTDASGSERLYLAICGQPADDATERRIAAWRRAVMQQCRWQTFHEFRLPVCADVEAIWHALDAGHDGVTLVAAFAPGAASLAMLRLAGPRADAMYDATMQRLAIGATGHGDPERCHALMRAVVDGLRRDRDGATSSVDWTSRDRRWRCAFRRCDAGETVAAAEPTTAALALLQRVSGYPVHDALASGDMHLRLAIDSIMAMEYAERFRAAFGRRLPVEALLDRPPLHAVVERIGICLRESGSDDAFRPLGRGRAVEGWL